jgi:hypothetical protein
MHADLSPAQAERDRLIADLHRAVDSVADAIDRTTAELVERAAELQLEITRLADEAAELSAALRGEEGEPRPEPEPEPQQEPTLDDVERSREAIASAPAGGDPRIPRFRKPGHEVPEGVRLTVTQMRLQGKSKEAIVDYLERMGVRDPETTIARIES